MTTNNPVTDRARAKIVQAVIEEYDHSRQLSPPLATNILTKQSVRDALDAFERDILAGQSVGDYVLVPRKVVNFLNGQGSLEGAWFGEKVEGKRAFWWRKHLAATPASDSPAIPDYAKAKVAYGPLSKDMLIQLLAERDAALPTPASHTAPDALLHKVTQIIEYCGVDASHECDEPLEARHRFAAQAARDILALVDRSGERDAFGRTDAQRRADIAALATPAPSRDEVGPTCGICDHPFRNHQVGLGGYVCPSRPATALNKDTSDVQ